MPSRKIELLAPARDKACGIAAINHGADSVYIGAPRFGARAAAANSLQDIEQLVRYAHQFRSKVYVALNTLFSDDELESAVQLSHQLADVGIDALIIQDVGLLESELPPIALHSSTQMNNQTVEKVDFLEKVGFSQVVLARELSLEAISKIRVATSVVLEFFVHGALCVSYSGQCYISEVIAGRSANRGECAQFCRHKFDLKSQDGRVIERDKHLLSLRDLDLSSYLNELIGVGVDSFKIEGRLKNMGYVKNVTAHYRSLLDKILETRSDLSPSSSGRCEFAFVPDPAKSFNRGKTEYFIKNSRNVVGDTRTPKSKGKFLGAIRQVNKRFFIVDSKEEIHNGDGLCFFNSKNELVGIRVNRVEGDTIFPKDGAERLKLVAGMRFYRNLDTVFNKQLQASDVCRKISLRLKLKEVVEGLLLEITDEDNIYSKVVLPLLKEKSRKPGTGRVVEKQLKKSGGTIFLVSGVETFLDPENHYSSSDINKIRRSGFQNHLQVRQQSYEVYHTILDPSDYPWPGDRVEYQDNLTNAKAAQFYQRHGIKKSDLQAAIFDVKELDSTALMTTKYCIKAQLGVCPKDNKKTSLKDATLVLADKIGEYSVSFDCKKCVMVVGSGTNKKE